MYLRNFLTKTHLQDLIESTAQIHYESFRSKQLLALKEQSAAMSQVKISFKSTGLFANHHKHSGGQRNVSAPYAR